MKPWWQRAKGFPELDVQRAALEAMDPTGSARETLSRIRYEAYRQTLRLAALSNGGKPDLKVVK